MKLPDAVRLDAPGIMATRAGMGAAGEKRAVAPVLCCCRVAGVSGFLISGRLVLCRLGSEGGSDRVEVDEHGGP